MSVKCCERRTYNGPVPLTSGARVKAAWLWLFFFPPFPFKFSFPAPNVFPPSRELGLQSPYPRFSHSPAIEWREGQSKHGQKLSGPPSQCHMRHPHSSIAYTPQVSLSSRPETDSLPPSNGFPFPGSNSRSETKLGFFPRPWARGCRLGRRRKALVCGKR